MKGISELVWLYIKRRPFLKEILRERIVNYSALARKISAEVFMDKEYENAVKMALLRLSNKIRKREEDLEGKILEVLNRSSISIQNKVAVVISTKELEDLDYLSFVEGKGFFTYMLEEEKLGRIRKSKSIPIIKTNLNLITVHSSPELEETPGVIAHILNVLASEGINVVEFVSCYTDTMLVIKEADTARVYDLLSKITAKE